MNITKRIEDAIKALEAGRLKEALYLTDKDSLLRHHQWVEEAARTCLENKDNPGVCKEAIREAKEKLERTITPPMEDTSLEGLEEYLGEKTPVKPSSQMTDEERFESCEECHVAEAVVAVTDLCDESPQNVCTLIGERIGNEDITPEDWLKVLVEARDKMVGPAKQKVERIVGGLIDYLERRKSPFLKALEKED